MIGRQRCRRGHGEALDVLPNPGVGFLPCKDDGSERETTGGESCGTFERITLPVGTVSGETRSVAGATAKNPFMKCSAGPARVAGRSASFAESARRLLSSQKPIRESRRCCRVTAQVMQFDDRPRGGNEGSAQTAVGADVSSESAGELLREL